MPILDKDDYLPGRFLRNGHVNTFYAYLRRKDPYPHFTRQRIHTRDKDFIDIDWLQKGSKKLAVLCHGLEGSSESQYIRGTSDLLHNHGWDIAAMNYRGCSGENNLQLKTYHSGATDDLIDLLDTVANPYDEIVLVGFSLGGNLVLKYAGEKGDALHPKITHVVGVSVPCDLSEGSVYLQQLQNYLYNRNFINSLVSKARQKHEQFPGSFDVKALDNIKDLKAYDDAFTAPINGFKDAEDYYTKCSSINYLDKIRRKSLIISALDDPFLPKASYPFELCKKLTDVHFLPTKFGGHVGFSLPGKVYFWEELKILDFLNDELC